MNPSTRFRAAALALAVLSFHSMASASEGRLVTTLARPLPRLILRETAWGRHFAESVLGRSVRTNADLEALARRLQRLGRADEVSLRLEGAEGDLRAAVAEGTTVPRVVIERAAARAVAFRPEAETSGRLVFSNAASAPRAVDLFLSAPALDSAAVDLIPHYVQQGTDASCSLASSTIVINGLRARLGIHPALSQAQILSRANVKEWTRAVAQGGDGIPLDRLEAVLNEALPRLGLPEARARGLHPRPGSQRDLAAFLGQLDSAVVRGKGALLVTFDQGLLLEGVAGEGHWATVGAYDRSRRLVLLLDPDPTLRPFWVSVENLYAAMTAPESASLTRGFLRVELP